MQTSEIDRFDWFRFYKMDSTRDIEIHQLGIEDLNDEVAAVLTPIAITEKILELNGFNYISINSFAPTMYKYLDEWHKVEVHFCDGTASYADLYNEHGKFTDTVHIHINYIHQLQHAMRLCGMADLANRFVLF